MTLCTTLSSEIVCQECQAAVTLFLVTLLSCEISAMECDAKRHRPGEHKVELELQLKIVTSSPVRQSWLPYQRNQQVINFVICSSQLTAHSSQLSALSGRPADSSRNTNSYWTDFTSCLRLGRG